MTHEHIRDAILAMDETVLTPERVSQLAKIAPKVEEIEMVKSFSGELTQLANTERFYLTLGDIPRLDVRLELFLFKQQFPGSLIQVADQLDRVEKAVTGIRSSDHLKHLFKILLAIGNYMNGNTNKGQAYGFKLGCLSRLKQSKTADNSSNLLQYLVNYVGKHSPQTRGFITDIASVKDAVNVEEDALVAEMKKTTATLSKIQTELKQNESEEKTEDRFYRVMQAFVNDAAPKFTEMEQRLDKLQKDFKALQSYLGAAEAELKWQDLLKMFDEFLKSFTQAQHEVEQAQIKSEQDAKRKEFDKGMRALAAAQHSRNPSAGNSPLPKEMMGQPATAERKRLVGAVPLIPTALLGDTPTKPADSSPRSPTSRSKRGSESKGEITTLTEATSVSAEAKANMAKELFKTLKRGKIPSTPGKPEAPSTPNTKWKMSSKKHTLQAMMQSSDVKDQTLNELKNRAPKQSQTPSTSTSTPASNKSYSSAAASASVSASKSISSSSAADSDPSTLQPATATATSNTATPDSTPRGRQQAKGRNKKR